ncbi:MAG: alpha/beta hydrolase [Candidatus Sericytochromatia bacterium]
MDSKFKCTAKSKYISLRNLKFHYLEWENADKPIVIMLHGFMDHSHSFDLLAEELKDKYHLIAWDARGFGKTEHIHPASYYYFFDYILDLELFIKNFTNNPVILIGHSMGGIISSLYAGTYPEKVSKIISLEGWFMTAYEYNEAPERARNWIDGVNNLKSFKLMNSLEEATQRLIKNDPLLTKEFAKHLAEEIIVRKDNKFVWSHDPLHKTRTPQLSYYGHIKAFLEKIECPILLIESDKTFFDLENYERIAQLYKNADKLKINDAGHNLHIHKPKEIAKEIIEFIENN